MSARLAPCPGCARHVKVGDAACPFCGAAAPVSAPAPRAVAKGATRAAIAALAVAAAAASVAACDGQTKVAPLPEDDAGDAATVIDATTGDASDGGATVDASDGASDAASDVFQGSDVGVQPPYGLPPTDSGSD